MTEKRVKILVLSPGLLLDLLRSKRYLVTGGQIPTVISISGLPADASPTFVSVSLEEMNIKIGIESETFPVNREGEHLVKFQLTAVSKIITGPQYNSVAALADASLAPEPTDDMEALRGERVALRIRLQELDALFGEDGPLPEPVLHAGIDGENATPAPGVTRIDTEQYRRGGAFADSGDGPPYLEYSRDAALLRDEEDAEAEIAANELNSGISGIEPPRYYTGDESSKAGDRHTVFGWYEAQEWETVELIRQTSLGWLVKRIDDGATA